MLKRCHLSSSDLSVLVYIFQMIVPSFVCVCLWVEDRLGVCWGEQRWHVSIFNSHFKVHESLRCSITPLAVSKIKSLLLYKLSKCIWFFLCQYGAVTLYQMLIFTVFTLWNSRSLSRGSWIGESQKNHESIKALEKNILTSCEDVQFLWVW